MSTKDTFGDKTGVAIIRQGASQQEREDAIRGALRQAGVPIPDEQTKATLSDTEKLAKIREVIVTCLSTESLKRSVVTREIADILGLPHEGPEPEARAFVERLKSNLAKRGYSR